MKGVNRKPFGVVWKQAREPLRHLGGGTAGERDGETVLRRGATLGDQMGDPIGEGAGLARAGAGDDQQRAIDRRGGGALVRVELRENIGRGAVGLGTDNTQLRLCRFDDLAIARRLIGRHPLDRLRLRSSGDRRIEQRCARRQPLELVVLEQADHAVFAVIAGVADHLTGAQARDRLGEQRRAGAGDVLDRHGLQDRKLGAELGDRLIVVALDRLRFHAAGGDLGENLRQRHQVGDLAGSRGRRRLRLAAIGERLDPMLDADRQRLAADRAASAMLAGLLRGQPHLAFAVAVEVILAFVRKELDRAHIAMAGLQCVLDREVVEVAVEGRRLAAELAGRMRVGIRREPVAVEKRNPPIHRRIGGEAGLDREDAVRQVAVALGDRIKPRLRSERREPRRPDMGRHQIGVRAGFERDLQQVARIEAEDRTAVRGDVADAGEPRRHAIDRLEIGRIDQMVDFAGALALLVDRRNLDLEHEPHRGAAWCRQRRHHGLLDVVAQAKEPRLGSNELVAELGAPSRMGKVAGRHHPDTLAARPGGEVLEIEIPAGGSRVFRVDVQVRVEGHPMPRLLVGVRPTPPRCRVMAEDDAP